MQSLAGLSEEDHRVVCAHERATLNMMLTTYGDFIAKGIRKEEILPSQLEVDLVIEAVDHGHMTAVSLAHYFQPEIFEFPHRQPLGNYPFSLSDADSSREYHDPCMLEEIFGKAGMFIERLMRFGLNAERTIFVPEPAYAAQIRKDPRISKALDTTIIRATPEVLSSLKAVLPEYLL